jgi:hypothetical protein
LFDIDGNSFSRRLLPFLRSRSLIFRWNVFTVWFDGIVKPFLHYIPVPYDFSEFEKTISLYQENEELSEQIALNSFEFSKKHLRMEDMYCYAARALIEYEMLLL